MTKSHEKSYIQYVRGPELNEYIDGLKKIEDVVLQIEQIIKKTGEVDFLVESVPKKDYLQTVTSTKLKKAESKIRRLEKEIEFLKAAANTPGIEKMWELWKEINNFTEND